MELCAWSSSRQDSKLLEPSWLSCYPRFLEIITSKKKFFLTVLVNYDNWSIVHSNLGKVMWLSLVKVGSVDRCGSSSFHHLLTLPRPNTILSYQDSDPCTLHAVSGGKIKKKKKRPTYHGMSDDLSLEVIEGKKTSCSVTVKNVMNLVTLEAWEGCLSLAH